MKVSKMNLRKTLIAVAAAGAPSPGGNHGHAGAPASAEERLRTRSTPVVRKIAEEHGIEVPATTRSPYSTDENLWGRSIEAGVLEDPWAEPPKDVFAWTRDPRQCPDEPAYDTLNLTDYDPQSVMHYFCGAVGSRELAITELDRLGSQKVYGPSLSAMMLVDQRRPAPPSGRAASPGLPDGC